MIVKHQIRRGLALGAVYLLTAVMVNELLQRDVVGIEAAARMMGILRGLMVLVLANAVPKRLVPLARLYCDPVREQTLRRFCGKLMVLGGLGYTLAYALAPMPYAGKLAFWLLEPPGLVFAVILVRCAWVRRRAMRGEA